ncbi:hypothetical protein QHG06_000914 [Shigella sonnei]|nr:hypothetical protein [Shigella sonnei]
MPPRSWVERGYNLEHWSSPNALRPKSAGFFGYTADMLIACMTHSIRRIRLPRNLILTSIAMMITGAKKEIK